MAVTIEHTRKQNKTVSKKKWKEKKQWAAK